MNFADRIARYVTRHPVKTQRGLEILPGFVSWSLILFPIWGSFVIPQVVAYYVITFSVYWLYRSITMAIFSILAHLKIRAASKFDWLTDLKQQFPKDWHTIHHCIIIPTYKEPLETLTRTLTALQKQTFPRENLHIVLSFEEREGAAAKQKATALAAQFNQTFGTLLTTFHHDFLTRPDRYDCIWQGSIVFYNNIWSVPAPIRVLASLFSVIQMHLLMRSDRLINFSTYSTSFKHIVDIDYWDTNVIPEDYRLFFKSYFAKRGAFEVHPIFLPIYSDAAESSTRWQSYKNQYEQLKRWAWGVSDDAYIIKQYLTTPNVPFWDKSIRVLKTIEDHFLWPVNWFAITVSAFFPPRLNEEFNRTVIGKTLPQVTSALLTASLISMVVVFVIDALNRPPRPKKRLLLSYIFQPLEFLMLPIIGFFFSALPGIDAHTRLMLGKYL